MRLAPANPYAPRTAGSPPDRRFPRLVRLVSMIRVNGFAAHRRLVGPHGPGGWLLVVSYLRGRWGTSRASRPQRGCDGCWVALDRQPRFRQPALAGASCHMTARQAADEPWRQLWRKLRARLPLSLARKLGLLGRHRPPVRRRRLLELPTGFASARQSGVVADGAHYGHGPSSPAWSGG